MDYREYDAPVALAPWIRCVWTLRAPSSGPQVIVPDGRCELIVSRGDPIFDLDDDSWQPRVMLAGQLREWMRIAPSGVVDLVGIRFRPDGLRAFLDVPAAEWTGRRVDVAAIERRLEGELAGAGASRILEVLAGRLRPRPDTGLRAALQAIERGGGNVSVASVAAEAGVGARALERMFRRSVGLTAKRLSRIVRVQRTIRAVEGSGRFDGAFLAATCGYADQSHMIREFRALAGMTPGRYFATEHPLADFLTGVSDSSNPAS